MKNYAVYVFAGIFAAAAVVHLCAIALKKQKAERISKILLLPPLLAAYIAGARTPLVTVIIAVAAGWAGDIFLINIKKPLFFRLGLASFLAGHVCYIPSMLRFTEKISLPVLAVSAVLFFAGGVVLYRLIRPDAAMRVPVVLYEIAILLMSLAALQLLVSGKNAPGALAFAGSLLFLVSDSFLARFLFNAKPAWGDFAIMTSYIAAQAALVSALAAL
ncbi:MAG: lysoplasmalogenase [Treponema sp.]|jgi:uncharacterized membrane protein YhhN|nr:lysoplasmalogenase [Treponema sp.]